LHFEMYRTLPTRIGLIEASRRKSWDTLLDPVVGELPVAAQLPQVRSTDFDSIRMAVLKSDDWQIFIRYGQIVPQHAQEDALSTEIYFKDVPVSISPGTVAYGSKLHSEYFHRAVSHNVPMVDGHGQTGWDRGLMNSFDAVGASLEASQPNYRPDATAVRRVFIKDGQLVDHVALHLKQGIAGEKRLGFLFHWDCELELVKDQLGTEAVAVPPRGDGFAFWDQIRVRQAPKNWQAKLGCGKQDFAVEVSTSTPSNVYTAKAPSKPVPAKRAVIYIEITGRDATVEIRLKPVNLSQPPVMQ
jgi:hypothetical protein